MFNRVKSFRYSLKFVPSVSGNELCLVQLALKPGDARSIIKGQYLLCWTEYEHVLYLNSQKMKK